MDPFDYHDTPMPLKYFVQKYGVSRSTLRRYRRVGLRSIRVGAKTFVRESDFVMFLEKMNGKTAGVGQEATP